MMALKAATTEGTTTGVGWAQELTDSGMGDFYRELPPSSITAALIRNGACQIDLGRLNSLTVPKDTRDTMPAEWHEEGKMLPVKQDQLSSVTMNRASIGVISTFTNELQKVSVPQIEAIIRRSVLEDTSTGIGTYLIDNSDAVSGLRPAGLLFGVTPQASAGSDIAGVLDDLKFLANAMIVARAVSPCLLIHPINVAALRML